MSARSPREAKVSVTTVFHFEEAISFSRYRIVIAPPLYDLVPFRALRRATDGLLFKVRDLLVHPLILLIAIRHHRAELIIIRYFTTKALLVAAPLLWPFRKKLLFTIQNNMQLAHVGARERRYFKLLCRLGFQFAFLEAADGLAELGVPFDDRQFVVVPIPIFPRQSSRHERRRDGPPTIGVIGRELPEKNTDRLMNLLVGWRSAGDLPAEIVLGSNDKDVLETWAGKGVATVQTLDYRDYKQAVAGVDVLLIHYDRTHYFFRSSGVIHDAAHLGTAVVCPDFPVFRRQVSEPCRVGAVYRTVDDMLPSLREALELSRRASGDFEAWALERSPQVFSQRVDRLIEQRRGR